MFLVKLVVSYLIEFIFASHKNQNKRAQPDWNVSPQKTQATIDKAVSKIKKIDTHPKNEVIAKQNIKTNLVFIINEFIRSWQQSSDVNIFGSYLRILDGVKINGKLERWLDRVVNWIFEVHKYHTF